MQKWLCVTLALTGCANVDCPESADTGQPNRFLWKTYKREIGGIAAGTRFLAGDLGNFGVCQEVADMYNSRPSVVDADALTFSCGPKAIESAPRSVGSGERQPKGKWGFVDGAAADAPWHWEASELQCYRALAARREYERREGRSADVFGINCVDKSW
jgi:hypothetical protein